MIGRVITSLKHLLWAKVFATIPCLILFNPVRRIQLWASFYRSRIQGFSRINRVPESQHLQMTGWFFFFYPTFYDSRGRARCHSPLSFQKSFCDYKYPSSTLIFKFCLKDSPRPSRQAGRSPGCTHLIVPPACPRPPSRNNCFKLCCVWGFCLGFDMKEDFCY